MQDEIIKVETVHEDNYNARKMATYNFLHSNPANWQPAEIKTWLPGRNGIEFPVFHLGSIKKVNNCIEFIHDEADYEKVKTPYSNNYSCHLCGHPIINIYYIINYTEKKVMQVGCECVNNSYAKEITKLRKIYKDNLIRQEFIFARAEIIPLLKNKKDTSSAYAIKTGKIEYWAWRLMWDLNKIKVEETTSRKLKNKLDAIKQSMSVLKTDGEKK